MHEIMRVFHLSNNCHSPSTSQFRREASNPFVSLTVNISLILCFAVLRKQHDKRSKFITMQLAFKNVHVYVAYTKI